jgi:hypothetical protein
MCTCATSLPTPQVRQHRQLQVQPRFPCRPQLPLLAQPQLLRQIDLQQRRMQQLPKLTDRSLASGGALTTRQPRSRWRTARLNNGCQQLGRHGGDVFTDSEPPSHTHSNPRENRAVYLAWPLWSVFAVGMGIGVRIRVGTADNAAGAERQPATLSAVVTASDCARFHACDAETYV